MSLEALKQLYMASHPKGYTFILPIFKEALEGLLRPLRMPNGMLPDMVEEMYYVNPNSPLLIQPDYTPPPHEFMEL